MTYLLIAFGSALGGVARYGLGQLVSARVAPGFPLGTFLVNVIGSFAIGLAAAAAAQAKPAGAQLLRDFVMIGFLGGFTTFSAFSLQTLELLRDGKLMLAAANVGASVVVCLLAVGLGFVLAARTM